MLNKAGIIACFVVEEGRGLSYESEPGNKRTFRSCGIRSITIYTKTLAELESYHRKNGKWKKYRMDLKVLLQADVRDNECFAAEVGGETKSKKKAELESNVTFWGAANYNGYSYRAELGSSIFGSFTYAGNSTVYTLQ